MEKIIQKYMFLENDRFGQIVKMIYRYVDGEEINETFGDTENIIFFDRYVRNDVDKVIKERNRKRGNKNGKR